MIPALMTLLLFGAPAGAFWLLVSGLDPIGRLVVAGLASLVTVSGVGGFMLITGLWSPGGGLVAVLALSVLLAALGVVQTRRDTRRRQTALTRREGLPIPPAARKTASADSSPSTEGDEWLYES